MESSIIGTINDGRPSPEYHRVNSNSQGDEADADRGFGPLLDEVVAEDESRQDDIERRYERIAPAAVRSLGIGQPAAEDEDGRNGHRFEDDGPKHGEVG